eukprot:GAHX01001716.1.p1 GENE.GAHX01001716.1~~GAHX01001716.1.p1  ORF type:complete len:201 (+),score=23.76 GAHX01001716.1:31-603(+)
MILCPLCTDEFRTRKALNIHLSKMHKECTMGIKKNKITTIRDIAWDKQHIQTDKSAPELVKESNITPVPTKTNSQMVNLTANPRSNQNLSKLLSNTNTMAGKETQYQESCSIPIVGMEDSTAFPMISTERKEFCSNDISTQNYTILYPTIIGSFILQSSVKYDKETNTYLCFQSLEEPTHIYQKKQKSEH